MDLHLGTPSKKSTEYQQDTTTSLENTPPPKGNKRGKEGEPRRRGRPLSPPASPPPPTSPASPSAAAASKMPQMPRILDQTCLRAFLNSFDNVLTDCDGEFEPRWCEIMVVFF